MTDFCEKVDEIVPLRGWCRPGLQALKKQDRQHIAHRDATLLSGSVDLDTAMKKSCPQDPRWDYVVAERSANQEALHWIEVHPATSGSHFDDMTKKIHWLKNWLDQQGRQLNHYPRVFVWVASGKSYFSQRSPQVKQMAALGVRMAGARYEFG